MDCVGYCRFSSDAQRDGYSIDAQVRAIKEWASREGHVVKKFYIDEARTGTNDNRDEFQQMIADAATGTFQAVVVHKLDRFARDRYDSAVYRHKLKAHGVRVVSVLEPLDDSPESVMMEAVLEGMAEYYSKNLSREVRKGKTEAARAAKHNGGIVPYGFALTEDGHYTVAPDEAAVIREMFAMLDNGSSYADVARWAKAKGLKSRRGTIMDGYTVRRIIGNPMLIGNYVFARIPSATQAPIVVENAFEAIITPEQYQRIQAKIAAQKHAPRSRNKGDDYLLTGYLFCEECGNHLYGYSAKQKYQKLDGSLQVYIRSHYRCSRRRGTGCHLRSFVKSTLEDFVFGAIDEVLFKGPTVDWIVVELSERLKKRTASADEASSVLKSYERELKNIYGKRDRLLDLYLSGDISKAAYSEKAHDLETRAEYLQSEIKRMTPAAPVSVSAAALKKALTAYADSANADSPEYKKRILSTFVEKITISNEHIVIYFKFPVPGAGDKTEKALSGDLVRKGASVVTLAVLRTEFPIAAVNAHDYSVFTIELV